MEELFIISENPMRRELNPTMHNESCSWVPHQLFSTLQEVARIGADANTNSFSGIHNAQSIPGGEGK